jgi:hypothetical protein
MRLFLSVVIGVVLGIAGGLFVGWVLAPTEYVDSPMRGLATRYQEEYTVMVAAGFSVDRDVNAVLQRLAPLGQDNIPQYVQSLTERYITLSRDVDDIRLLVILSEGLGRFTPVMENFRTLNPEGTTP